MAIIGGGVDYTRPEIAARLARDGEGEIIGWDFVDNDRRPYDGCREPHQDSPCANISSGLIKGPHEQTRLIILRTQPSSPHSAVAAVNAAARMPTKIVLFSYPLPAGFIREAAMRSPSQFFVGIATDKEEIAGANYLALRPDMPAGLALGVVEIEVIKAIRILRSTPQLDGKEIKRAVIGGGGGAKP